MPLASPGGFPVRDWFLFWDHLMIRCCVDVKLHETRRRTRAQVRKCRWERRTYLLGTQPRNLTFRCWNLNHLWSPFHGRRKFLSRNGTNPRGWVPSTWQKVPLVDRVNESLLHVYVLYIGRQTVPFRTSWSLHVRLICSASKIPRTGQTNPVGAARAGIATSMVSLYMFYNIKRLKKEKQNLYYWRGLRPCRPIVLCIFRLAGWPEQRNYRWGYY